MPEEVRARRAHATWLVEHRQEMDRGESSWLEALAAFDQEQGWAVDGQLSCVDWLRWKTNMARATCYEKLHVARHLANRPVVAEAFRAATISYSAVRTICRIDDPTEEVDAALVTLARRGRVTDIERAVDHFLKLADQQRPPVDPTLRRALRIRPELDGWARIEITLPQVEVAELITALEAFLAIGARPEQETHDPESATADSPAGDNRAAGDAAAESAVADGPAGEDRAAESAAADGSTAESAAGDDPAAKSAAADSQTPGGSPGGTEPPAASHPEPSAAADDQASTEPGGAGGPATSESATADNMVERPAMRSRRAEAFVDLVRCALAHADGGQAAGTDRYLVHVVARHGQVTFPDGTPLHDRDAATITCDTSLVAHTIGDHGEPLAQGRKSRVWSTAQRRAVLVRDGGHCRFPGCERRTVDIHHRVPWSEGGTTNVDNGMAVCPRHHTLLHHGYTVHADNNGDLHFHRPDRSTLGTTSPIQHHLADLRAVA